MGDQAQIEHLLRRTEYVARPARVTQLMNLTSGTSALDAAVDDILNVTTPVAIPPEIFVGSNWDQYITATKWWFDRMAFDSPRSIQEKMTFFWHGHFTSEAQKVESMRMMMSQNALYRDNAFGNFLTLAQAMAIEPAMLRYLDNVDNTKTSPNQNFGRELLELFLLGVGNYAETDVEAAARAWTGHTVNNSGSYWFDSSKHDTGQKTFFGLTGNWNGPDIVSMVFANKPQIVSRYIVGKLWNFFATPVGPQPAALNTIAANFAINWEIKPMMRAILLLPEFYSTATMQGLVRSPVDWIVACMSLTGYDAETLSPQWFTESMGQVPFNPPNVAGWHANGTWINTSSMGARADFAENVVNHLRNDSAYNWDVLLRRNGNVVVPVAQAIDVVATLFALKPLSVPTQTGMTNYVTAERNPSSPHRNSWWEITNLLQMAMVAPEMHVA